MPVDDTTNATIANGPTPSNHDTPAFINGFRVAYGHKHEGALRKTAKQMGATVGGELHECKGCSKAKAICMSIPSKTDNRAGVKPSVTGEGNENRQNQIESEETASQIETPEAKATASITSEKVRTSSPSASSSESGVSFDPEDIMLFCEGLVTASASGSTSDMPDQRYATLHACKVRQLAEHIPRPPRFNFGDEQRG